MGRDVYFLWVFGGTSLMSGTIEIVRRGEDCLNRCTTSMRYGFGCIAIDKQIDMAIELAIHLLKQRPYRKKGDIVILVGQSNYDQYQYS
jgi:hypothetical protein